MSIWVYEDKPFNIIPEDAYAFVYEITNTSTGMKYIGKKFFYSKRTLPPLKGKKRKRHITKESDWKTYTSSSKPLNADIDLYGMDVFEFKIISLHPNKTEANYHELRTQIMYDVLDKVNSDGDRIYYNLNIDRIYYPSEPNRQTRVNLFESLKSPQ